jgi:hypothetical protein
MLLPPTFKQDFPQAVQNLEKNQESKFLQFGMFRAKIFEF